MEWATSVAQWKDFLENIMEERDKKLKKELARLPITLFCVHGNHEERAGLLDTYVEKEWNGGVVYWESQFQKLEKNICMILK